MFGVAVITTLKNRTLPAALTARHCKSVLCSIYQSCYLLRRDYAVTFVSVPVEPLSLCVIKIYEVAPFTLFQVSVTLESPTVAGND